MHISRPPKSQISQSSPLHQAVESEDAEKITQLRHEGQRPTLLNSQRESPIDALDKKMHLDKTLRDKLHSSLLGSLNPTAPAGYKKPEALHGTPWGLEILKSGMLKGGVNDAKGGWQSLEGKVFFSDRTPETENSDTTRANLRAKPRTYGRGTSMQVSGAASRAIQHRMSMVLNQQFSEGRALNHNATSATINLNDQSNEPEALASWLQNIINAQTLNQPKRKLTAMDDSKLENILKFPLMLKITHPDGTKDIYAGDALTAKITQAAATLQNVLEAGKAPLLSMINHGEVIPIVFGFGKITDLKAHQIDAVMGPDAKQYHYQDNDHPLSGTDKGGRLQEIELRNVEDLATLMLGCQAQQVTIPEDVLIRLRPPSGKAQYIDAQQLASFNRQLNESLPSDCVSPREASIAQLQTMNRYLRQQPLESFLPPRSES
ncbi:hypothetical protein [Serratia ficaria]|uniref:hypothetical protein n=1 Tax=Serratia ficaria TaxID=61651 RepID=UPI00077C5483|nr:hypothetical protein [Serratia ficaria]